MKANDLERLEKIYGVRIKKFKPGSDAPAGYYQITKKWQPNAALDKPFWLGSNIREVETKLSQIYF